MTPAEIGAAIRRTREYKNLSQMVAAGLIDKNRTWVSRAEFHTDKLLLRSLIKYLDVLGLEIVIQPKKIKSTDTSQSCTESAQLL